MHQILSRSVQRCMLQSSAVILIHSQCKVISLQNDPLFKQTLRNYKARNSCIENFLQVSSLCKHDRKKLNTNSFKNKVKSWVVKSAQIFDKWITQVSPTGKKFVDDFTTGALRTWSDIQTYRYVKKRLKVNPFAPVTYSEEMQIFFLKQDALKVAPLIPFFLVPFGFFMLFIPIYFFPKYVLPHTFYTESQQKTFYSSFHQNRLKHYNIIIHHMNYHKINTTDSSLYNTLNDICSNIDSRNVPSNSTLLQLKPYCNTSNSPFNLELQNVYLLLQSFSKACMLTSYLPSNWLCSQLQNHGVFVMQLDKKIRDENLLKKLSSKDIKAASFIRGLNSADLSLEANIYWLENWLALTKLCDSNDHWFILHAMILLSLNFSELKYQRKVFN